jgi:hypothetical protein
MNKYIVAFVKLLFHVLVEALSDSDRVCKVTATGEMNTI